MKKVKQQSREHSRISIDDSRHSTYRELAKRTDKDSSVEETETRPFEFMKNLFMLATIIGYRDKKRIPLGKATDIFSWQTFSVDEVSLLNALAVADTNSVDVLRDQKEILRIAEEYANGGIVQIIEEVSQMPGDKLDNLVDLLANLIQDPSRSDSK